MRFRDSAGESFARGGRSICSSLTFSARFAIWLSNVPHLGYKISCGDAPSRTLAVSGWEKRQLFPVSSSALFGGTRPARYGTGIGFLDQRPYLSILPYCSKNILAAIDVS